MTGKQKKDFQKVIGVCIVGIILILLIPMFFRFITSHNAEKEIERTQISNAPAAKFEYIDEADTGYKLITSEVDLLDSFDTLALAPTDSDFSGDWIYRITFYPKETNPDDTEVIIMFGQASVCIDGKNYIPEKDVDYSTILSWAADKYEAFDYELVTQ